MNTDGGSVVHVYIIFILCCFGYGAWSLYKHIEWLEETIVIQNEAIEKQNQANRILRQYIYIHSSSIQSPIYKQDSRPDQLRLD